jgi:hypothetical protein
MTTPSNQKTSYGCLFPAVILRNQCLISRMGAALTIRMMPVMAPMSEVSGICISGPKYANNMEGAYLEIDLAFKPTISRGVQDGNGKESISWTRRSCTVETMDYEKSMKALWLSEEVPHQGPLPPLWMWVGSLRPGSLM